jgi:hydrophobe/amphiphile efflux-3 (HAE3) family protein
MWSIITGFIIRHRLWFLAIILALTAFMGYHAREVKLSYDLPQVIPESDPDYVFYQNFKKQYGEDGDMLIIGFQEKDLFHQDIFNKWLELTQKLQNSKGIKSVADVPTVQVLEKDTATHKFRMRPFVTKPVGSKAEMDSLKNAYLQMPFYQNLFYNDSTHATMMAVKLENKTLHSSDRLLAINTINDLAEEFSQKSGIKLHFSGLPYIRTVFAQKIQKELNIFLALSILITSIILLIFFRSFYAVIFPLALITVIIIWTLGLIGLLGYKLTLLTGLIPPLIVIIAVPNFIYFFNRYHNEYRKYGNKMIGIVRMVENIAKVVLLNNVTTAIGFGVLFLVKSPVLKEFGMIAFIMICIIYVVTLVLLPAIFSYLPEPNSRQTKYLNNKYMMGFVGFVDKLAQHHRKWVYTVTIALSLISLYGVSRLHAVGYIMDDIPSSDQLSIDLAFFEDNFTGIMPFEVEVDTHKKNGLLNLTTLQNLSDFEDSIKALPQIAGALSVVDITKFARQAFYNGSPEMYSIPERREQVFMMPYLKGFNINNGTSGNYNIVDSNFQKARISARISDCGSVQLTKIVSRLQKDADSLFKEPVTFHFTGYSLIFLKGNKYLIDNLASSLTMAVLMITFMIALMFRSVRLVIITLIPNILALLITASLMGYLNIPLKASTVLVFSIAFGIAVDASFHFLVNYRQDLKRHNWDIPKAISVALKETGASIIYTSLVLFFGFGIFCFSTFGSTVALGALSSLTILCAMFTNIIIIPALLISFDKKKPIKQ